jgi:hypothetical protein
MRKAAIELTRAYPHGSIRPGVAGPGGRRDAAMSRGEPGRLRPVRRCSRRTASTRMPSQGCRVAPARAAGASCPDHCGELLGERAEPRTDPPRTQGGRLMLAEEGQSAAGINFLLDEVEQSRTIAAADTASCAPADLAANRPATRTAAGSRPRRPLVGPRHREPRPGAAGHRTLSHRRRNAVTSGERPRIIAGSVSVNTLSAVRHADRRTSLACPTWTSMRRSRSRSATSATARSGAAQGPVSWSSAL